MTPLALTDGGKHWTARECAFPTPVIAFSLPARDRGYVDSAGGRAAYDVGEVPGPTPDLEAYQPECAEIHAV